MGAFLGVVKTLSHVIYRKFKIFFYIKIPLKMADMRSKDSKNQEPATLTLTNCIPKMGKLYAFTMRKLKNVSRDLNILYNKIKWLEKLFKCKVKEFYVEYCKTGEPHLHGVFETQGDIKEDHIKARGWHNLCKPVTDIEGWIRYIKKAQPTDQDHEDFNKYIEEQKQICPPSPTIIPKRNLFR